MPRVEALLRQQRTTAPPRGRRADLRRLGKSLAEPHPRGYGDHAHRRWVEQNSRMLFLPRKMPGASRMSAASDFIVPDLAVAPAIYTGSVPPPSPHRPRVFRNQGDTAIARPAPLGESHRRLPCCRTAPIHASAGGSLITSSSPASAGLHGRWTDQSGGSTTAWTTPPLAMDQDVLRWASGIWGHAFRPPCSRVPHRSPCIRPAPITRYHQLLILNRRPSYLAICMTTPAHS